MASRCVRVEEQLVGPQWRQMCPLGAGGYQVNCLLPEVAAHLGMPIISVYMYKAQAAHPARNVPGAMSQQGRLKGSGAKQAQLPLELDAKQPPSFSEVLCEG